MAQWQRMTSVGFEPTPFRNGALSHRLRPLGQNVLLLHDLRPPRRLEVGGKLLKAEGVKVGDKILKIALLKVQDER